MEKRDIMQVLQHVYDPDYVNRSIVDMGLVSEDDITITGDKVEVAYGLTAPLCPFSAAIGLMIKYAVEKSLGVAASVRLRPGHRQTGAVAELLQDPQREKELMGLLDDYGIIDRCVRLDEGE